MTSAHPSSPASPAVDLLLTGFEPFDRAPCNESWDAVLLAAAALRAGGLTVTTLELPVVFDGAGDALVAALAEHRPRVAIAVGLAAGRTALTPERVAINVRDARIPDNAGHQPVDEPVVAGGPVGFFATLPIKAMVEAARRELALPAAVSQTAGTFVCNDVFYRLQHALAGDAPRARGRSAGTALLSTRGGGGTARGTRSGFIHVPAAADLAVEDTARGLALMARTALEVTTDAQVTGGSIA